MAREQMDQIESSINLADELAVAGLAKVRESSDQWVNNLRPQSCVPSLGSDDSEEFISEFLSTPDIQIVSAILTEINGDRKVLEAVLRSHRPQFVVSLDIRFFGDICLTFELHQIVD